MKKIVVLVGSYYPDFSAVGKCMNNIVCELETSYEIIIIANHTQFSQDSECRYRKQKIKRISTPEKWFRLYIDRKKKGKYILYFFKIYRYLKTLFSRSSVNKTLCKRYLNELNKIQDIDVILCCCLPIETIIAAINYKISNTETKVIPFLFDKFAASNTLHRNGLNKKLKFCKHQKIESNFLNYCDFFFYVHSWTTYLKDFFPQHLNKGNLIEHPLIVNKVNKDNKKNSCITILYAGSIIRNYVEIDYLLNMLRIGDDLDLEFRFYMNDYGITCLKQYNGKIKCRSYSWISSDELDSEFRNCDILLNIAEKNGVQVSSKIFNYISTGKPIIHIYYTDKDANLEYLKKYPNCLCINAKYSLSENWEKLSVWCHNNRYKTIDFNEISMIFNEYTPSYIADILKNSLDLSN